MVIARPIKKAQSTVTSKPFTPSAYQQAIFDFPSNFEGNLLVNATAGSGKLQPYDELVLTPYGFTEMRNIHAGDFVIAHDGKPVEVLKVFHGKDLNIYSVHFEDGSQVECCEDHLWAVQTVHQRKTRSRHYFVKTLKDIIRDIQNHPRQSTKDGYFYSVPNCDAVQFASSPVDLDPYLLGWLIGDGYFSDRGASISIWDRDADEVANLLKPLLPADCTGTLYKVSPSNPHVQRFHITKAIRSYLSALGLDEKKSQDKFVPDLYKYNSIEIRKAILAGLLDTDSNVMRFESGKVKIRFSSTSERLAEDVAELVRSLGGNSSISKNKRDEFSVSIRLPFNPYLLTRRKETYGEYQPKQAFSRSITDIKYVGKKDGQCLLIDHPDHLYVTRNYVVTHNTTTAIKLIDYLEGSTLFVAFNKHIADTIQKRVPGAIVKTVHALGFSAVRAYLGQCTIEAWKYSELCKSEAGLIVSEAFKSASYQEKSEYARELTEILVTLLRYAHNSIVWGSDTEAMESLLDHYGVELKTFKFSTICEAIQRIQDKGIEIAKNERVIDYTDMIWLPVVLDYQIDQFDWVIGDEIQDWSKLQLEVVAKAVNPFGGRFIGVGDPRQSIYGFAGADTDSFENIRTRFDAQVLPLSICYRCPTSHIKLAQEIEPKIEASPSAIEGEIEWIKDTSLFSYVAPGDLVLCRLTAPLVQTCINLIASKVPAKVVGRDIGKGLQKLAEDISKHPNFKFEDFLRYSEEYFKIQSKKLSQRRNAEAKIGSLRDRIDGLEVCFASFRVNNLQDFYREINNLFSDDKTPISLSTIHRAKGLEADNVFIIAPEKLPLFWKNQQDHEKVQEKNLEFVAYTRAKKKLTFVETTER